MVEIAHMHKDLNTSLAQRAVFVSSLYHDCINITHRLIYYEESLFWGGSRPEEAFKLTATHTRMTVTYSNTFSGPHTQTETARGTERLQSRRRSQPQDTMKLSVPHPPSKTIEVRANPATIRACCLLGCCESVSLCSLGTYSTTKHNLVYL